jgi:hypothetical protein
LRRELSRERRAEQGAPEAIALREIERAQDLVLGVRRDQHGELATMRHAEDALALFHARVELTQRASVARREPTEVQRCGGERELEMRRIAHHDATGRLDDRRLPAAEHFVRTAEHHAGDPFRDEPAEIRVRGVEPTHGARIRELDARRVEELAVAARAVVQRDAAGGDVT